MTNFHHNWSQSFPEKVHQVQKNFKELFWRKMRSYISMCITTVRDSPAKYMRVLTVSISSTKPFLMFPFLLQQSLLSYELRNSMFSTRSLWGLLRPTVQHPHPVMLIVAKTAIDVISTLQHFKWNVPMSPSEHLFLFFFFFFLDSSTRSADPLTDCCLCLTLEALAQKALQWNCLENCLSFFQNRCWNCLNGNMPHNYLH